MKATIVGDKELIALLQNVKKTKAKAAIRKGSRAGCKVIAAQAVADAPVKTGRLKSSIKVRALSRSRRWTGTEVSVRPTGPTFYAFFLEFGTKTKGGKPRIAPRRFILKAAMKVQRTAQATFVNGIKEGLS